MVANRTLDSDDLSFEPIFLDLYIVGHLQHLVMSLLDQSLLTTDSWFSSKYS